ncbi:MAG: NERD domain-containing protein [Thiobacillus sp.]
MILKEKQFTQQNDRLRAAGDAAEKQMAFYLKRAFGSAKDIWVINDLRVEHEDEAAQIDHLLISQWGLFIIESKSVTGSVHINTHGEWAREYSNDKQGMPSPVLQAEAQGRLLKQLLKENTSKLLGKLVGMQKGFGYCPVLVYAAISDKGIIHREIDLPQVMKADAVIPVIEAWLKKCSIFKGLLSLSLEVKPGEWKMAINEAEAVAEFFVSCHAPLPSSKSDAVTKGGGKSVTLPTQALPIQEGQTCPECGQHRLDRKTLTRGGTSTRNFLACAGYPKSCKGIFPLPDTNSLPPALSASKPQPQSEHADGVKHQPGDVCPWCKDGKLVERKGKTLFLGCSNYGKRQKCTFRDYSYKPMTF